MIWKKIGQSVIGTSHLHSGKVCEDACIYRVFTLPDENEALICFVSDGAGSAKFGGEAAKVAVSLAANLANEFLSTGGDLTERLLITMVENIYDELEAMATKACQPKNEFSCTLLGCIILPEKAGFLQIGDGAIIRNDGSDHYTQVWWPQNGEYQNSTAFLIDDPNLSNLNKKIIEEPIIEVAIFSDGLQQLVLNHFTTSVHQPFFNNVFLSLRKATEVEHLSILNSKLIDYLSGDSINCRTDDDKTLVLATRA